MAKKILLWISAIFLALLVAIATFIFSFYSKTELESIANSYFLALETSLTREQRLSLAEHIPILDFAAYACRKEDSSGKRTGFLRGETQGIAKGEKIVCPGGTVLFTETKASVQFFGNEKKYRFLLREGTVWIEMPAGKSILSFEEGVADVVTTAKTSTFRLSKTDPLHILCANGLAKIEAVSEKGSLGIGTANCKLDLHLPATESNLQFYYGDGNLLENLPGVPHVAGLEKWIRTVSKQMVTLATYGNGEKNGSYTLSWSVYDFLSPTNCKISVRRGESWKTSSVELTGGNGYLSLSAEDKPTEAALTCDAGELTLTSPRLVL